MSRIDRYGVRHVTADDPVTPEGNAHIAACPECRAAFPQVAKPRRFNPWALLWIPVVLIVVSFMGSVLSHTPATVSATDPSPSISASHVPVVIYQRSGSGEFTSDYFTTPAEWKVEWSYDCGAGHDGFFGLNTAGTSITHDGASGADVSWVHDAAGQHYVRIFAGCPWTVKVIG